MLHLLVTLCVCLGLSLEAFGAGLVDNPIVGSGIVYLDGKWSVKSTSKISITGQVPGDLITDLFNAGIIPEPYYEVNWISNSSVWTDANWTYSTTFILDVAAAKETLLVFDGVKMGAEVFLNGELIGVVNDQFLRYNFSVQRSLRASNLLEVVFPTHYSINTDGRFMACAGGWDWAPYSHQTSYGATAFTQGIWKSVYLVTIETVAITHVVPAVKYLGAYPTAPLTDTTHAPFEIKVTVYFHAPSPVTGTLKLFGDWGETKSITTTIPAGESMATLNLTASSVMLWWPAGLGKANLYNVSVVFVPSSGTPLADSRRIGFRVFSLVTVDDANPAPYVGGDGSGNFTMRFKVNGANIYSRGGNMIPIEEFEGRASEQAFTYMLQSVVDGNMNTLRIWGGGIFLYDIFYDTCDELGILLYHDMMYAQGGHSPSNTPTQDAELRHNIRRLSHHPSIVIWDGCNECGGGGIYAQFVVTVISQEDQSRVLWPSCPSFGWDTGVDTLYGTPNGKTLASRTRGHTFETHGPYQHGAGYPAVNGNANVNADLFNPYLPPGLNAPGSSGVTSPGMYASEFGCVAMSSFESMSVYLAPEHWTLHTSAMSQRNYPCDNVILEYWGAQNNSLVGAFAFQKQLYQCIVGSALNIKSNIENRRSGNEFGTIVWQLGEVWPTGGWGSLEYASPVKGQVVGGRWKPVHYFYRNSLFSDVIATCGIDANCYVKNDGTVPFVGSVKIAAVNLATGKVSLVLSHPVTLAAGAGVISWVCLGTAVNGKCPSYETVLANYDCTVKTCVLDITVATLTSTVVSHHVLLLLPPHNLTLSKTAVTSAVAANTQGGADVTLTTTGAPALYTVLTTTANGRFSDNAFLLLPGTTVVQFIPFGPFKLSDLSSTLRVEHAQTYL